MVDQFNRANIRMLGEAGYSVHVATNFAGGSTPLWRNQQLASDLEADGVSIHSVSFERQPLSWSNVQAFVELIRLMRRERFDLVHCQSPVGGVLTRIAARVASSHKPAVIYTAHGFHFHRGGSWVNWAIYYPTEWLLGRVTDVLVTVNEEDRRAARRFGARLVLTIPGVGINRTVFVPPAPGRRRNLRVAMGIQPDSYIVISVGELNANKDQSRLIRAVGLMRDRGLTATVLLVGQGPLEHDCRKLAEDLGLVESVRFLGYRTDVDQLMQLSDAAALVSHREGLPVNVLEAMASGLPCVVSDVRGSRDLVDTGVTGIVLDDWSDESLAEALLRLADEPATRQRMGTAARQASGKFSNETVNEQMAEIYALATGLSRRRRA